MAKRKEDPVPASAHEKLELMPLGAGNEVGRSCIYMSYMGKHIMFDCGVHPGHSGIASLPYFDEIDPSSIDVLLITHFHLDHAASLPYLLFKTTFRGRVFMTHATRAVYGIMLSDFVRVTKGSPDGALFSDKEVAESMKRIEVVDFHQVREVNGIKFWAYVAGHVLGAAMFAVEIAGVRVLYTGDYSREEDRHLKAAEVPAFSPDLCVIESTFGIQVHEPRPVREKRFVESVSNTILGGGRVLIPAYSLGRAQELLLILDEYWQLHPELQDFPIFYASPLGKKTMAVYETYTGTMNDHMKELFSTTNPFDFKFVKDLTNVAKFEDNGPCVVLASPGGLQGGASRQLFDLWCQDRRNLCLIPGFTVQGTLAKTLLSEPKEVTLMNGSKVPLHMQIEHISFAAHSDFQETSSFLEAIAPPNIVLVHGESTEMMRLKAKLEEQFKDRNGVVLAPKNSAVAEFHFKVEKTARAVGKLAHWQPSKDKGATGPPGEAGAVEGTISGILVQKEFEYQLVAPEDLSSHTQLSTGAVVQRQAVPYQGPFRVVKSRLERMFDKTEEDPQAPVPSVSIGGKLTVAQESADRLVLQWVSDPVADVVADTVLALILQLEGTGQADVGPALEVPGAKEGVKGEGYSGASEHTLLTKLLRDMFGSAESSSEDADQVKVQLDGLEAVVSLPSGSVECSDNVLRGQVQAAVTRMLSAIRPIPIS